MKILCSTADGTQFSCITSSPYHPHHWGLLISYKILLLLQKLSSKMIRDAKLQTKICTLLLGHLLPNPYTKLFTPTLAFTATVNFSPASHPKDPFWGFPESHVFVIHSAEEPGCSNCWTANVPG